MRLILIALLLSGCAYDPTFTDKTVDVRIIVVDYDLKQTGGKEAYALAWPETKPCLIKIERKHYTHEIIGHEIRHCFDGYWHD